MAVRLSALRAGRALPPRNLPGTHFCYRLSRPQGRSAAGRNRSIEKKIPLIGTQTRDPPVCSIVPQPTTLPLALTVCCKLIQIKFVKKKKPVDLVIRYTAECLFISLCNILNQRH
jgi:hypothetical protein